MLARASGQTFVFESLPLDPAVNPPVTLCQINGVLFKEAILARMRSHVQPMALQEDGSRSAIPAYIGALVFSFLMVKHKTENGTTYYRCSLPIILRVLLDLHMEYDGADPSNWIEYPFHFEE